MMGISARWRRERELHEALGRGLEVKEAGMVSKTAARWWARIAFAGLVMTILVCGGCAAERDPINRVQANAIPKTFFVGAKINDTSDDPEFYARSMVINVPYGESSSDLLMVTNTLN